MRSRRAFLIALIGIYLLMWFGGVVSYVFYGGPPADARWTAAAFLFLAGLIVAVASPATDLKWLVVAAMMGFISELAGIHLGFIFSPYRYTEVLQPQVAGVPLVMIAAWMTLLAYVWQMLRGLQLSRWPKWCDVAIGAAWMTAIDFVIDPLAANSLGYWEWAQSGFYYGIPWRNFVGWFVVSALIFVLVRRRFEMNPWARFIGLSIILFFTIIAFAHRLVLAGAFGALLCFIHYALARSLLNNERLAAQVIK
jgi:putative membrane protein